METAADAFASYSGTRRSAPEDSARSLAKGFAGGVAGVAFAALLPEDKPWEALLANFGYNLSRKLLTIKHLTVRDLLSVALDAAASSVMSFVISGSLQPVGQKQKALFEALARGDEVAKYAVDATKLGITLLIGIPVKTGVNELSDWLTAG